MAERTEEQLALRATLASIAPGTDLRDGLERILRGRTGALIVIGSDRTVESIASGGFDLDVPFSATGLRVLEVEWAKDSGGAGLAQLNSAIYADWPDESDRVPLRFNHAENEILLTTADDFPAQFRSDVVSGPGGRQVLVADPSGNLVELFEPA